MNQNFMHWGKGHCYICHCDYYQTHQCTLDSVFPTPCNQLTCGPWYQYNKGSFGSDLPDQEPPARAKGE